MPRELKQTAKRAGRRGNNEGSIYQRNDGRWCAQATIGYDENGKVFKEYVYVISRAEVARKLTKYTQGVFENGYAAFSPNEKIWSSEVFEEWFVTFKKSNISSPTVEKLRNLMKNHIFKAFDTTGLSQIDLLKFQRFFNGESKVLSNQSIKHMKQRINQFFEYAVKNKRVESNPISEIKIREVERREDQKERMALMPEQC